MAGQDEDNLKPVAIISQIGPRTIFSFVNTLLLSLRHP